VDAALDRIRFIAAWQDAEEAQGREYGPILFAMPVGAWRSAMDDNPAFRAWGTLRFLVDRVHECLYEGPHVALERAAIIVHYAPYVDVPEPGYKIALQGLAWKIYANALRHSGDLRAALLTAERSQRFFNTASGFTLESAKARLVEAQVRHDLGEHDRAITMARACAAVFRDYEDARSYVFARMTEAWVLFGLKQFRQAADIFRETAADAEARSDKHTLASCLHNTAECARELGDIKSARELDARALALFEELGAGIAMDKPRVRWAYGLSLADEGRIQEGIWQILKAREELLALGVNGDAAVATLDAVRLKYDRGDDVIHLCTELVQTFAQAGMTQNALESLAYLREQARSGTISVKKIATVQTYLRELPTAPLQLFVRPREEREER
jgi:tetratricopeptide (TPR) repeat protein